MRTFDFKGKQFGRFAQVEIRNFVTGQKHTFGNEFNISFEFFKTIDEIDKASVGQIKIDGVSRETVEKISSEGGEVHFYCGYTNTEIQLLFVAHIVRMYAQSGNGNSSLIIECSANVIDYYFTPYGGGDEAEVLSPVGLIRKFSLASGADGEIDLTPAPDDVEAALIEFFMTAYYRVDYVGDPRHMLKELCDLFHLQMTTHDNLDSNSQYTKKNIFTLKTTGVNDLLRIINEGYPKINRTGEEVKFAEKQQEYKNLFVDRKEEYRRAWFLSYKTGLLSYQPEFRVVNALLTKELAANESLTVKQQRQELELNEKQREKVLKEAQRKEKAIEKGKEFKPKKQKIVQRQVTRQFLRVKALLNPSVKPQSHIMIIENEVFKIFRVREIIFKGVNNSSGEWIMELFCEDSGGRYDRNPTAYEINSMQKDTSSDTVAVNGEQGNNTNYGVTDE